MASENDDSKSGREGGPPDVVALHLAFAEAAIFLVESLLLVLHERRVLTKEDVLDVVRTAVEAKKDLVEHDVHREISSVGSGVLKRIENSLSATTPQSPVDLGGK